jgi:membrane protein implicated in regulation of membrane protease activity
VVESLHVDGSTTVPIKINRYVLLAGLPVETSQLAIAIIIVLSVLLVLSLEVYRRRRNKSQKTDS